MSEKSAFITHDGKDEHGISAEVYVQKGRGVISSLAPNKNKRSVSVSIEVEGLRYPVVAWTNLEGEFYKEITKAWDNNEEISYRVEAQRKPGVDRTIPIDELRVDAKIAQEKIRSILAAVNDKISEEAVTNPAKDPSITGRYRDEEEPAKPTPTPPPSNNNNQPRNAGGNQHVLESAPYKMFNDDGTLNLGSYSVQATTRVEEFVRHQLLENGWSAEDSSFNREVYGFGMVILNIADRLQSFFTNKPVNRMATSHTRLRGIIFDNIEHFYTFKMLKEGELTKEEWWKSVGALAKTRFLVVGELNKPNSSFNFEEFLGIAKPEQNQATDEPNVPQPVAHNQNATQQAPEQPQETQRTDAQVEEAALSVRPPERHVTPIPERQVAAPPERQSDDNSDEPSGMQALRNMSVSSVSMFTPIDTAIDPETTPDELAEMNSELREMLVSFGFGENLGALSTMLHYTFNKAKTNEVNIDDLVGFKVFYEEAEEENPGNFAQAVEMATEELKKR